MAMAAAAAAAARGPSVAVCDAAIIVPTYNVEEFIAEALSSVLAQTGVDLTSLELVLYDDASTDATWANAGALLPRLQAALGSVTFIAGADGPTGCGSARNRAIEASQAPVLIFLDSDDVMLPDRVARTLAALPPSDSGAASASREGVVGVVGGNFERFPAGSTPRYAAYHRRISGSTAQRDGLFVYSFRDVPLAMPTVSCLRRVWEDVGAFVEGRGISEDLWFQYGAMERGYVLDKLAGEPLVRYRYHDRMTSNILTRLHMLSVRVAAFERLVMLKEGWESFSIWGAGRDGKEFFKLLSDDAKTRVCAWGEVNPRKIGKDIYGVPVVHWSELTPPIATCVALDRREREFEDNLASLRLLPGVDYVHIN
jgi:glycosyltransferase involved in cell wall biosynthesis